ncbi:MAG TPA: 2-oxo acid dehydrogenase subunit E2 [Deltaproteobacteria bacterium]|nr:2-oxo acid dehydrogenase subunit E2 [Deltaproteobacteria bacterium]
MAVNIIMPKWGHTMEEGKITKWLKQEGDTVQKGEELFEVETEKITNTVEAIAGGILFQILVPVGSSARVSAVVAVLAEPGETLEPVKAVAADKPAAAEAATAAEEKAAPVEAQAPAPVPAAGGFVRATPAARRLARELGIDIGRVRGSGPEGRVTEKDVSQFSEGIPAGVRISPLAEEMARQAGLDISTLSGTGDGGKIVVADVERALARQAEPQPVRSMPFTGMRKSIADNMHASLANTAQLTAFSEVDVTEMVKFRDLVRKEYQNDENIRISFNDIFILAASRALKRFPIINSTLVGDEILIHGSVHMGIAVALPEGLIVPVLKDADQKGLLRIAEESRILIRKAREGKLSVDEVTGGTFTITNLSMFPVDGFTPILRPPESGILGLCRIHEKPSVYNGEIAIRSMMTISLTWDHRVVDGAPASEFLQALCRFLEEPTLIMT